MCWRPHHARWGASVHFTICPFVGAMRHKDYTTPVFVHHRIVAHNRMVPHILR